jgi:hypothetical protein
MPGLHEQTKDLLLHLSKRAREGAQKNDTIALPSRCMSDLRIAAEHQERFVEHLADNRVLARVLDSYLDWSDCPTGTQEGSERPLV